VPHHDPSVGRDPPYRFYLIFLLYSVFFGLYSFLSLLEKATASIIEHSGYDSSEAATS
jgi:hypothetical protein